MTKKYIIVPAEISAESAKLAYPDEVPTYTLNPQKYHFHTPKCGGDMDSYNTFSKNATTFFSDFY